MHRRRNYTGSVGRTDCDHKVLLNRVIKKPNIVVNYSFVQMMEALGNVIELCYVKRNGHGRDDNMLFLDANAFYSYFGRAKLGMRASPVDEAALCRFLDNHHEKSLPTSVFMEIVTHYREDADTLNIFIQFCELNGLPLYNNIPDYCISSDEITAVSIVGKVGIQSYAKRILEEKIKIEARFGPIGRFKLFKFCK